MWYVTKIYEDGKRVFGPKEPYSDGIPFGIREESERNTERSAVARHVVPVKCESAYRRERRDVRQESGDHPDVPRGPRGDRHKADSLVQQPHGRGKP